MNIPKTLDNIVIRASHPVDASSAAVFRILFGALSFIAVLRFFTNNWIDTLYVQPEFHFKYLGFEWVQPWPSWGMEIHFLALGILSLFIAAGFLYRISAVLFLFGFLYIELLDAVTYLNHYYWLSLTSALIIFMPLNRKWSVDAWMRPSIRSDTIPAWVIWLLRAQLSVVYFFGGIAKLNPDWLFEALPMKIWLYQHGDFPIFGRLLQQTWVAYAMSWAGAIYDLTIVGWLLWKRTRPYAFVVLIGFHLTTWQLFPALGMFPWLMIASMLLFFPPDWPRKIAKLLSSPRRGPLHNLRVSPARGGNVRQDKGGPKRNYTSPIPLDSDFRRNDVVTQSPRRQESSETTNRQGCPPAPLGPQGNGLRNSQTKPWLMRFAVITIATFAIAQIVIPLRHLAYPGNVRWNEEGYRFAWRMMLSEKIGFVTYRVTDNNSDQTWRIEPSEYLTPLQIERMSINPDMIHQLAFIIADDFRGRGYSDVSVFADAFVAFNGRSNTRIIDPNVDLASVERSVFAKHWISPAPNHRFETPSTAIAIGVSESNRDP